MDRLFQAGAVNIAPCNRGFVFAEVHKTIENGNVKNVIAFNQYSFDTQTITPITKNAYLNNVYLNHSDFLKEEISDYISSITVYTSNFGFVVLNPNGLARMYDYNCRFKWRGSLKYKGYAPADAVVHGDELWCSYPDSNTLIRYNTNSMRQEFKISSGVDTELSEPYGLFVVEDDLIITSQNSGVIQKMSLNDFEMSVLHTVDKPVKKYIKADSNEIILTDTGIYKL